jgi:hypothetical protein
LHRLSAEHKLNAGKDEAKARQYSLRGRMPEEPQQSDDVQANLMTAADCSATPIEDDVTATPQSLAATAASFAGSMLKFAASGFKTVDEQLHRLRLAQCEPCAHRRNTRCTLCRCFVVKKAWLPHEDCPLGRWPT